MLEERARPDALDRVDIGVGAQFSPDPSGRRKSNCAAGEEARTVLFGQGARRGARERLLQ